MNKRTRVAIFGAGLGGRRAFWCLRHRFQIVAFLDNDVSTQGRRVLGRPILSPAAIDSLNVGKIFIASMYTMHIYLQLVRELRVDPTRIETVNPAILSGEYRISPWTIIILALLIALFAGLTFMFLFLGYRLFVDL